MAHGNQGAAGSPCITLGFPVMAVIAALFGFTGIAGIAAWLAISLFVLLRIPPSSISGESIGQYDSG